MSLPLLSRFYRISQFKSQGLLTLLGLKSFAWKMGANNKDRGFTIRSIFPDRIVEGIRNWFHTVLF